MKWFCAVLDERCFPCWHLALDEIRGRFGMGTAKSDEEHGSLARRGYKNPELNSDRASERGRVQLSKDKDYTKTKPMSISTNDTSGC